ncbi:unnamed protein product [Spirodela intermedia]|uniref:Uncharacterized protein n=1 Tax=Spirodela intermedia TaxID=51605 RepID=A0A7I8IR22_SPIIN|nr:unnamed protein product [Spirodela intermedia]CAA6660389.1 unnamed protein product [Spirodela intermedia]
MAAKKGFEEFEPLFGKAVAELDTGPFAAGSVFHRPFLFYARALDPYRIDVVVTDFCSHTLDRRDETGVGSSCSEFLDYLIASLSSDDVRLVFGGGSTAKLVAHKSKGMPHISISLQKLAGLSSNDVMGNLSLTLYRNLKEKRGELAKECWRRIELEKSLAAEKEKSEYLQRQLDSLSFKRKVSRPKLSDNAVSVTGVSDIDATVNSEAQGPSERLIERDSPSTKMSQRAAPAHRRAKVRGALLLDCDDIDDS